jgi:hypothetical protein
MSERINTNQTPDRAIDYHLNNIIDINDNLEVTERGCISSNQFLHGRNDSMLINEHYMPSE